MVAEFVTFDNAVNAMPLVCRVLYEGAAYMAVLKNFLCFFLLPADYPPCGLSGGNYGSLLLNTVQARQKDFQNL